MMGVFMFPLTKATNIAATIAALLHVLLSSCLPCSSPTQQYNNASLRLDFTLINLYNHDLHIVRQANQGNIGDALYYDEQKRILAYVYFHSNVILTYTQDDDTEPMIIMAVGLQE